MIQVPHRLIGTKHAGCGAGERENLAGERIVQPALRRGYRGPTVRREESEKKFGEIEAKTLTL